MATLSRPLFESIDFEAIEKMLKEDPSLSNKGIPYDDSNQAKAHPLHRLSDSVFSKKLEEENAIRIAKLLLQYGAKIEGNDPEPTRDTPLLAASSLHADKLALFFIAEGANISHIGCHGGTALHWAAWCGRPVLVEALIKAKASINQLCIDFKSTPLFWTIHGFYSEGFKHPDLYLECVKLLINAGADPSIPNFEGATVFELLGDSYPEFVKVLNQHHI